MGMAFGITIDDVAAVLERNGQAKRSDKELDALLENLDVDRIERDALYGNDMEQQTDYAYDSIEEQLKEQGILS